MKKIILTGAAGRLCGYLREPLSKLCDTLISTDIQYDIGTLFEDEEYIQADLGDNVAMQSLMALSLIHI